MPVLSSQARAYSQTMDQVSAPPDTSRQVLGRMGAPSSSAVMDYETLLRMYQQGNLLNDLASYVKSSFDEARRHRIAIGMETEIMRSLRAINNEYDPEDRELLGGVDIFMGLTNLKARALKSWISDILINSEDRPWTLKPTPLPELPPEAEEAVIDALMREVQMYGMDVDLRDKAKYFKDVAQKHADKIAGEATKRMELKIADIMVEGGWRDAFTSFVSDLASFPVAIMKGPVVERVSGLRWANGKLNVVDRMKMRMKRVHPLDFFPAPNCTHPQSGAYLIERSRMTRDELMKSLTVPGFNEQAIRKLLANYPTGCEYRLPTDIEQAHLENAQLTMASLSSSDKRWHVMIFHGEVAGRMLAKHGVEIPDPQLGYEAEVWVCGDMVLRAMLNPHPLKQRPYYVASFEPVPGSIWGRGLPQLLRDAQRMCNSAARSLVRNMSFASGPIGEYDIDRLANETRITELQPFRMYAVTTDPLIQSNQTAIRFTKIDSNAEELLKVYEYWSKVADDISGIPAYVIGSPAAGAAGRTLGGLSMLMGNAARGVKALIGHIDRDLTEPVVQSIYTLVMLFDPDRTLKADASVIARGSAGLLQRELQQSKVIELLQMLTPYAQVADESGPVVPVEGLRVVIRDAIRGLGYTADDIIPDPNRKSQLMNIASAATEEPRTNAASPSVKLDGRSQPAINSQRQMAPLPA